MAQISQPLDAHPALILRLGGEPVQPIEHRNGLRGLLVENNNNLGHDTSPACSHYCEQWSRGQGTLFSIRHPARSEGPGLVAQDSRKEGIALSVACQSDPGGGDEKGELNLVRSFNKSIVM